MIIAVAKLIINLEKLKALRSQPLKLETFLTKMTRMRRRGTGQTFMLCWLLLSIAAASAASLQQNFPDKTDGSGVHIVISRADLNAARKSKVVSSSHGAASNNHRSASKSPESSAQSTEQSRSERALLRGKVAPVQVKTAAAKNRPAWTKRSGSFTSLPEIARITLYRHFGKLYDAGRVSLRRSADSDVRTGLNCRTAAKVRTDSGSRAAWNGRPSSNGSSSNGTLSSKAGERTDDGKTIAEWLGELKVEPAFLRPAGVFVTLSKNGQTRACWGSVYPREASIARETVISTLGALSKDYRFRPISATELDRLKVQVTVLRGLEAVTDLKSINPFKDGILVRSAGRGGVILPGEAVDAYYEFVLARLKAGIKPGEPCQIYRIRAEIYD